MKKIYRNKVSLKTRIKYMETRLMYSYSVRLAWSITIYNLKHALK